ncbi:NAD(P)/FAD-dependent oxidoreductase [Ectothiorhodospira sp. BSL-9]|uniref:dihydrolipoyl dehydrogenase family protein n=1 Tax=Ectothiorhodospira sp. BSL-9 TaxID=1442136 RepID=UPI0007B4243B|nr:mercuric reductase [Ectothiorhodospira sp. BSL-9]ANB01790.1 pyridine nucleotide-disulfide oxidoreductase [Ectothiorhodospira sp. BSL-9]
MNQSHDLILIGGGVSGLVIASVAGQLGLDVVLIERREKLGGDCLHYGCVPSKTLIRSAAVAHQMRRADQYGLQAMTPKVDLGRVMDRVRASINTLGEHDDPERFRNYGVCVRFGMARFIDPHTVEVDGERIRGRRLVIATGSRPAMPPIPGLADIDYWTNETVFDQRQLPARLAVLGGGPVGVELAQAFARLGSRVTVLQRPSSLLPREDPEIARELARQLSEEGLSVATGSAVESIISGEGEILLQGRNAEGGFQVPADAVLVATGRRPQIDDLGLEAAGVAVENGLIRVDRRMRTSQRHIYACGDCCGPYPFTHVAEYQAGIIIANAVFRLPKRADYRVVPRVTYTAPELAHVGLTETQAQALGMAIEVARFPFRDVDRAVCDGDTAGSAKLVIHKGRLVGATLLGSQAGELIHELVLAMQARLKISQISAAIHAYPTRAQVHRRAVNTLYAPRLFSPRTRRLAGWIQRILP